MSEANLDSAGSGSSAAGPLSGGESLSPLGGLDDDRVRELWDKYYGPLKQSIADRVRRIRRPVASESEIAASAFDSLIRGARAGKFPDLHEESGLWKLLRTIAVRKANDAQKRLWAEKRGGGLAPIGQYEAPEGEQGAVDLAAGFGLSPDSDLLVEELVGDLLEKLPNEKFRSVILLKLQGMENVEIAENVGTTTRSVQRMLQQVRRQWQSYTE
ncbi:MAG: ECF-type sigma factor [Aureliella sp.]